MKEGDMGARGTAPEVLTCPRNLERGRNRGERKAGPDPIHCGRKQPHPKKDLKENIVKRRLGKKEKRTIRKGKKELRKGNFVYVLEPHFLRKP